MLQSFPGPEQREDRLDMVRVFVEREVLPGINNGVINTPQEYGSVLERFKSSKDGVSGSDFGVENVWKFLMNVVMDIEAERGEDSGYEYSMRELQIIKAYDLAYRTAFPDSDSTGDVD